MIQRRMLIDVSHYSERSFNDVYALCQFLPGPNIVNLSILKNDRAKAIRFSTLEALCEVLNCQPGDLMTYE